MNEDDKSAPAMFLWLPDIPTRRVYTADTLQDIPQLSRLGSETLFALKVAAYVLPFKVNDFVLSELIDWTAAPNDPIYKLVFPNPEMFASDDFAMLLTLAKTNGFRSPEFATFARNVREGLNPHPGGQMLLNIPVSGQNTVHGLQHKYRETVLFFPLHGQTCHSYCSFCFRWPQFIGNKELRIAVADTVEAYKYIGSHKSVTDILFTGGDPMIMSTEYIKEMIKPLNNDEFAHVKTIRIGTKSLSYHPNRFVTDRDAEALLALFREQISFGRQVAFMLHINHPRELQPAAVRLALNRLHSSGVTLRSQAPVLRGINDSAEIWARLWSEQLALNIIPYYMFIERDTGAHRFFSVPIWRVLQIYRGAISTVSGLGRTARGPVMSATFGKVEVLGIRRLADTEVFVLRYIQARDPLLTYQPFFAVFDETATWFDELRPATEDDEKFFGRTR